MKESHLVLFHTVSQFWLSLCLVNAVLCPRFRLLVFKNTIGLLTHLRSSRTSFMSTRVICDISSGYHSYQILILLFLYCLIWRDICVITIHIHHRYLDLPHFARNIVYDYRNFIYPFRECYKLF